MQNKWRPEGWVNAFTKESGNLHPEADKEANIYESGADSILEALRETGYPISAESEIKSISMNIISAKKGVLVFIPDDPVAERENGAL